ncbi:hypothetical protein TWF718_011067 [Orbilia javanica]|uniref:BTB domain-containing protein n=1 Tax=Orbilia javanica TaxID=47235 RepID=A0AAN8MPH7_9PEZI
MSLQKIARPFESTPLYLYSKPDIVIIVGDEVLRAHEFVLASQSGFFKAALHSGLQESQTRRIELPEIEPKILLIVLNWLYRAPLERYWTHDQFSVQSSSQLKSILEAFDFLQIKGAERDYSKLLNDGLQAISSGSLYHSNKEVASIVMQLNEVYKAEGSVSVEALDRVFDEIYVRKSHGHNYALSHEFTGACGNLSNPNGNCFRDVALAIARVAHKKI